MPTTTTKRTSKPRKATAASTSYGGISDGAVKKATGKTWAEWCKRLDAAGCQEMAHKDIARLCADKFGVPPWWQQMVTVGYEQARGLRVRNQACDGEYQVSASKTIGVPIATAFEAWADDRTRARWLDAKAKLQITKATPHKSVRIKMSDGSRVGVSFWDKGKDKSQVSIDHKGLADAAAVDRMRKFWGEQLVAVKALLES